MFGNAHSKLKHTFTILFNTVLSDHVDSVYRNDRTASITQSAATSISSCVLNCPIPNRNVAFAKPASRPNAVNTCEGACFPDEQADPDETVIALCTASINFAPSTPSKLTLKHPGNRWVGWPFKCTPSRICNFSHNVWRSAVNR